MFEQSVNKQENYNRPMRYWHVALAIVCAVGQAGNGRLSAAPPAPVIAELFTSEGCSSCPPADRLLAQLAEASVDGALVVPLGEHVDYWDRLGWRDRFSSAALTERQQQYAIRFGGDGPYTPQLVVDGRDECVGSDAASARRAIAKAAAAPHGTLTIAVVDGRVRLSAVNLPQKADERANIVVAITEDGLRSDVTRGENRGRRLTHVAVVRQLGVVGEAAGATAFVERPLPVTSEWRREALHIVAFVQQRRAGAVLAAATVPLVPHP